MAEPTRFYIGDPNQTKQCTICKQYKPLDQFGSHAGRKDGLNNRCLRCATNKQTERYRRKKREAEASTFYADQDFWFGEQSRDYIQGEVVGPPMMGPNLSGMDAGVLYQIPSVELPKVLKLANARAVMEGHSLGQPRILMIELDGTNATLENWANGLKRGQIVRIEVDKNLQYNCRIVGEAEPEKLYRQKDKVFYERQRYS